jgi:UDP-N-acetylmuramoyl-tripeptide--D-alanyl-D-alanine ligase
VLLVSNVQRALEEICTAYRRTLQIPVVGITGSVGKTTAKEMISAVLAQRYRVLKTEGNHNNQIGVPMTVSRIEPEHELAVVEMGISGFGEMTELAAIARPTVAVFTVIGRAHLEFLHDLDGVFRAKTEMLAFLPVEIIQIPMIVFAVPAGITGMFRWK